MLYYRYNHLQCACVLGMHGVSHIAFSVYVCIYQQWSTCEFCAEHCASVTLCFPSSSLPPVVPAQPTRFEAEAELDTRIMLTWLWPMQDQIITKYELQYSEAGSDNKVRITTWP